jgi:hypothetical protein
LKAGKAIPGKIKKATDAVRESVALFDFCSALDFYGLAKVFSCIGAASASFAYELCALHQFFIILQTVLNIAHVYEIAQMFIMHRAWHLGFFHIFS